MVIRLKSTVEPELGSIALIEGIVAGDRACRLAAFADTAGVATAATITTAETKTRRISISNTFWDQNVRDLVSGTLEGSYRFSSAFSEASNVARRNRILRLS